MNEEYSFDYDRLRQDLITYLEGAYFGAGFGVALLERDKASKVSDEELLEIARRMGFSLEDYIVDKIITR